MYECVYKCARTRSPSSSSAQNSPEFLVQGYQERSRPSPSFQPSFAIVSPSAFTLVREFSFRAVFETVHRPIHPLALPCCPCRLFHGIVSGLVNFVPGLYRTSRFFAQPPNSTQRIKEVGPHNLFIFVQFMADDSFIQISWMPIAWLFGLWEILINARIKYVEVSFLRGKFNSVKRHASSFY